MKKGNFTCGWILFIFVFLVFPLFVQADGGMIAPLDQRIEETDQEAVILHKGEMETLILRANFEGDPKEFGWIIPTPAEPKVDKVPDEIFKALLEFAKPKIEAAVAEQWGLQNLASRKPEKEAIHIIKTKKVGVYDIAVLRAEHEQALSRWLDENNFYYPEEGRSVLEEYVSEGWYFVTAKIDPSRLEIENKSKGIKAHTPSLRFSFPAEKVVYPLKITGATESLEGPSYPGTGIEVLLYVITDHKMELPEFTTAYANWVSPRTLNELAKRENGSPVIDVEKKKYLTVLYNEMWPEDMTSDLYFKKAPNNKPVNVPPPFWLRAARWLKRYFYWLGGFMVLPGGIFIVIALIIYFSRRRWLRVGLQVLQGLIIFQSLYYLLMRLMGISTWKGLSSLGGRPLVAALLTLILGMMACMAWQHKRGKRQTKEFGEG